MKQKTIYSVIISSILSLFVLTGITYAATSNLESLRVGTAGGGGVTFFNGTILNESSSEPLTIGDDLRVDGRVWRGASAGTSDSQPFIINDNAEVAGSLTVGSTNVLDAIDGKAGTDHDHHSDYARLGRSRSLSIGGNSFLQENESCSVTRIQGAVFDGTCDTYILSLPLSSGVIIDSITVTYFDTSASEDVTVSLMVTDTGAESLIDQVISTGVDSDSIRTMTMSDLDRTVADGEAISLLASLLGGSDHAIYKVTVDYTEPSSNVMP